MTGAAAWALLASHLVVLSPVVDRGFESWAPAKLKANSGVRQPTAGRRSRSGLRSRFGPTYWNRSARDRPRGWVDAPSQSIIDIYSIVYAGYAATIRERGDSAQAQKADSVARKVSASLAPRAGKSRL